MPSYTHPGGVDCSPGVMGKGIGGFGLLGVPVCAVVVVFGLIVVGIVVDGAAVVDSQLKLSHASLFPLPSQ